MFRLSPRVAVLLAAVALSSGCGGPTGKGIHKDRDRPLPEKETTPLESLNAEETQIRDLVRDVYGPHIVNESISRSGGDAVLHLGLRDEKAASRDINLSRLARKKRDEGLSLAAIKASLRSEQGP
jgi:hypothetical protein